MTELDEKLDKNRAIQKYIQSLASIQDTKKLQEFIYRVKNTFVKHYGFCITLFSIFGFLILSKYYIWDISYTPTLSNTESVLFYGFAIATVGLIFILYTTFIYGILALIAIQINQSTRLSITAKHWFAGLTTLIYTAFAIANLADLYYNEDILCIATTCMIVSIGILSLFFGCKFAINSKLKAFGWLLMFEMIFIIPFGFTLQLINIENMPPMQFMVYIIAIASYAWLYVALIMKFATSPYKIFFAITLASLFVTCLVFPDQIAKNSHIGNYSPKMLYIDKQMQEVFITNGVKKDDIRPIDDNIIGVSNIKVLSNIGAEYYLEANGERFLIDSSSIKSEHIESQAAKKQNTNP
ncbi:hypothetical protein CQA49_07570 [Helicobacter sp. MIT 00-7814]|uniref:hypothetical protein n=1 Tax=unclassified Helicobacter TaxID=2593540 RepID=UPI000E1E5E78|nr:MULTISPECIES: hypothetical protein [unclassified Helicobacter]RDU52582.1 hypothetical protein CQA37_08275 [Helicobacter sp. MIT 99-10781]RDU52878.1 hypothetical protein CQA49_07570 [Helicobacter sp. MIT 00-7814]